MQNFVILVWNWTRALTVEAMIIVMSLALRPFAFIKDRESLESGRPILLIHGYLHNKSAWVYIRQHLRNEKIGPVFAINLGFPFHDILTYAEKVKKKCEEIEKISGRSDIILIGHSMGGLVASTYALKAPEQKKIDIITIGSPLLGTCFGFLSFGPNVWQMRYKGSFVKNLQKDILNQDRIRFFHLASQTDQIVIPQSSAIIEGKNHKNVVFSNLGHISLLFSPKVAKEVSSCLNEWKRVPHQ